MDAIKKLEQKGYNFWMDVWLDYGSANSLGPVGDFRLVVDKQKENSLVSFCGENVKKISATQFELRQKNYIPPDTIRILFSKDIAKAP